VTTFFRTTRVCIAASAAFMGVALSAPAHAQSAKPAWMIDSLLADAQKEGSVTVYSTTNEEEGLPLWKLFTDATGIKVNYVRASDSQLLARVIIEARAGQRSWDLMQTANVNKIPPQFLLPLDPPEGKKLEAQAIAKDKRWFGVYANYNSPAYNTKLVKTDDLPKTYEDFLKHKEWAGKVAIDGTDDAWMTGILEHYGEEKGVKLLKDIIDTVSPVAINGHLAVARAVGSGEYAIALNNYVNLTVNATLSGAPTDFWTLDPVILFFGQVGVSAQAPHPKAAQLAANFSISQEAQTFLTKFGRLPTRSDVATNPKDVLDKIKPRKIVTVLLDTEEDRRRIKQFNDLFKPR
jgi:iron(III) transport system substrate-binding protein